MERLVDLGSFLGGLGILLGGIGVLYGVSAWSQKSADSHSVWGWEVSRILAFGSSPLTLGPCYSSPTRKRPTGEHPSACPRDSRGDEEEGLSNSRRVPSRPLTVVTGSGKTRE